MVEPNAQFAGTTLKVDPWTKEAQLFKRRFIVRVATSPPQPLSGTVNGGAAGFGGGGGGGGGDGQADLAETTALHARATIIVQIPWRGAALLNMVEGVGGCTVRCGCPIDPAMIAMISIQRDRRRFDMCPLLKNDDKPPLRFVNNANVCKQRLSVPKDPRVDHRHPEWRSKSPPPALPSST